MDRVDRESVMPAGIEETWEAVRDPEWLGEPIEVVGEDPPYGLSFRWAGGDGSQVDITLTEEPEGTRVTVTEWRDAA